MTTNMGCCFDEVQEINNFDKHNRTEHTALLIKKEFRQKMDDITAIKRFVSERTPFNWSDQLLNAAKNFALPVSSRRYRSNRCAIAIKEAAHLPQTNVPLRTKKMDSCPGQRRERWACAYPIEGYHRHATKQHLRVTTCFIHVKACINNVHSPPPLS
ncbi:hypothetical protein QOT17_000940 [Balamuthia mandrillaris]